MKKCAKNLVRSDWPSQSVKMFAIEVKLAKLVVRGILREAILQSIFRLHTTEPYKRVEIVRKGFRTLRIEIFLIKFTLLFTLLLESS